MDERTNKLIARFYLKATSARDYSDWAVKCLEKGIDTKNICILASMFGNKFSYENEMFFEKSLQDLDWEFPTKEKCLKRYGNFVAEQILNVEIDSVEGFSLILKIYFDDDELKAEIKKKADNFLRNGKPKYPKYPKYPEDKPIFSDINENDGVLHKIRKKLF